jgi:asparagine synthase (glutamine-hydrolysing)
MFAFAIYDARRRRVLLVRDRVGKKPLYYAVLGGALHFASEIKSFQLSPAWDGAVDLTGLEGYLSLGYSIAPATVYRHVRQLEPGHLLVVQDGRLETRKYWEVGEFGTDQRAEAEILADLDGVLRDAVRARLDSDVPLGAFLSGGIDSGLVVSYMAESLGDRLITTSVGFKSAAHDETAVARLTAQRFGARHYAEHATPDLHEMLPALDAFFDEPFADSSAVPASCVSAMARRHVTVALSGDGGDETFAGYGFRYVPHAVEARMRRVMPRRAGRRSFRRLARLWPSTPALPRPLRLSTVWHNLAGDEADAYYRDLCFLKPGSTRRLLGRAPDEDPRSSAVYAAVTDPYRRCPSTSAVQRAQYADLKVYLPNDVLVKVDRTSMAHGLEVRSPFLDHRVIEFAFRLPTSRTMPRFEPKRLLRALARRRLPADVVAQPKRGFTAPAGEWIAGSGASMFRDEVLAPDSWVSAVVDLPHARGMFGQHLRGEADHTHALWALWMLERWGRAQRDVRRPPYERKAS